MKVTNDLELPQPIVNAVNRDDYNKGDCDFSTTGLIAPVRIQALKQKYGEHLVEDASERIFSLFGQAMHTVLERAADPRYHLVEKRYYTKFDFLGRTYVVGGRFDLMDYLIDTETNTLSDYKFTSRYAVNDGVKPEWEQQLNVNAYILRKFWFKIDRLQIVAIFRDWSKLRAEQKRDYPDRQIAILPVAYWKDIACESFIKERIKAHVEGAENPPVCTEEERWRKPDKWALMKKGSKRAIRLFDTEAQAEANVPQNLIPTSQYYVEPRPSEDVRCLHYCPVNKYCSYYQELMQEKIA
jgi:hypothetical protein